jgi:hypothetical protein
MEVSVPINYASKGELLWLPGIGEVSAGKIVAYRRMYGNLTRQTLEQLLKSLKVRLPDRVMESVDFKPNRELISDDLATVARSDLSWDYHGGVAVSKGRQPRGGSLPAQEQTMSVKPGVVKLSQSLTLEQSIEVDRLSRCSTPKGSGASMSLHLTPIVGSVTSFANEDPSFLNESEARVARGVTKTSFANQDPSLLLNESEARVARGVPKTIFAIQDPSFLNGSEARVARGVTPTPTSRPLPSQGLMKGFATPQMEQRLRNLGLPGKSPRMALGFELSSEFPDVPEGFHRYASVGNTSKGEREVVRSERSGKMYVKLNETVRTEREVVMSTSRGEREVVRSERSGKMYVKLDETVRSETEKRYGKLDDTVMSKTGKLYVKVNESGTERKRVTDSASKRYVRADQTAESFVKVSEKSRENVSYGKEVKSMNETPEGYIRMQTLNETPAGYVRASDLSQEGKRGERVNEASGITSSKQKVRQIKDVLKGVPKSLTYDGKTNWTAFRLRFSRYVEALQFTERECLDCLRFSLCGKAADLYAIVAEGKGPLTYISLLERLERRFGVKELQETLRVKFYQSVQASGETLEDWSDRILTLATKAFQDCSEHYLNKQCVLRFCQGLVDKDAAEHACNRDSETMEAALNVVQWYQHNHLAIHGKSGRKETAHVMAVQTRQRGSIESVICYKCGNAGHYKSDCPLSKGTEDPTAKPWQTAKPWVSRETSGGSLEKLEVQMSKVARELKRLADVKPPTTRACFHCGAFDHIIRFCPKLAAKGSSNPQAQPQAQLQADPQAQPPANPQAQPQANLHVTPALNGDGSGQVSGTRPQL